MSHHETLSALEETWRTHRRNIDALLADEELQGAMFVTGFKSAYYHSTPEDPDAFNDMYQAAMTDMLACYQEVQTNGHTLSELHLLRNHSDPATSQTYPQDTAGLLRAVRHLLDRMETHATALRPYVPREHQPKMDGPFASLSTIATSLIEALEDSNVAAKHMIAAQTGHISDGIKPGYKHTEAGVIPGDWEASSIGKVATFSGGSQPPRSTFRFSPSAGYIRLIQIRDYKSDDFSTYIPESMARKRCSADDIMIGRYGPPVFQILRGIEGSYNVALIKTTPDPQKIDQEYFYYFLKIDQLFLLIDSLSRRTSGQTGVEMSALKGYPLPLPPLPEQRAIAEALGDVDSLLGALDRLIAKKRDLKQAAMQQLLTGQTRLPGFHGEWVVKRLGDFLDKVVGGGTPSRNNPEYWGDEIPWVTVKDFATFNPQQAQESITRLGLKNSASHLIPAGTLITSTRMALGRAVVYEVDVAINQDLKALFLKSDVDIHFVYFWFEANAKVIDDLGSGSTVKGISIAQLKGIQFPGILLSEQTAIAAVLSDMDVELAALERRREKTRALKQGMMQELLTGRTRLV